MKLLAFLLRAGLMLLPAMALPALASDALWLKTMESFKSSKQMVAGDIHTTSTVTKGDAILGKSNVQSHLSGWDKALPVYATIELDPTPGASKEKAQNAANFMKTVIALEESMLVPDAKVTRSDGQKRDGRTWTVFQIEDASTGQKMLAKVWVDAESACIHQIDTDAHITLSLDAHIKTSYLPDAQGHCLPGQSDTDMDILVPFMGMKMKSRRISANWIKSPV